MSREAPSIVFDERGTVGFLDPDARPEADAAGMASIHLEDGRSVAVPAAALAREADGRYRLAVPRDGLVEGGTGEIVVPVVAEVAEVGKRTVERGKVRVRKGVSSRVEDVAVPLVREEVEVERVPVNRPVDGPVEVRREGDVWIVPILEEVVVVEKRLMLKEELRIRRRRVEETRTERLTLRTESATVERDALDGGDKVQIDQI